MVKFRSFRLWRWWVGYTSRSCPGARMDQFLDRIFRINMFRRHIMLIKLFFAIQSHLTEIAFKPTLSRVENIIPRYFDEYFDFLKKNSIFDERFYFWRKFQFFEEKFHFWRKVLFLTKISIFSLNFDFWGKFPFFG